LFHVSQKRTFALASDMTRQYKRKVEDMAREKSEEEQLRLQVEDKLAALTLSKAALERSMLQSLQLKDAEIAEQKAKMDQMAFEFGQWENAREHSASRWACATLQKWYLLILACTHPCVVSLCLSAPCRPNAQGPARQDDRKDRDHERGAHTCSTTRGVHAHVQVSPRTGSPSLVRCLLLVLCSAPQWHSHSAAAEGHPIVRTFEDFHLGQGR